MSAEIYVGTSGFYYRHWVGIFYPPDLPKSRWLEYYMEHFNTLEINSTFYRTPSSKTIERWSELAKEGFLYSLKAPRIITHYKKLQDCREDVEAFLNLLQPLKPKVGAVLFQLPPSLHYDLKLLKNFLDILPPLYPYAVEFRHKSWYEEEVYELLKNKNIAFCIHDFSRRQTPFVVTADFIYIRFHGKNGRYIGSYDDEVLANWAQKIKEAAKREEVKRIFCYFNNDFYGYAIKDARRLISLLKS